MSLAHKFGIGDRLDFVPGRLDVNIPRGVYTVLRLMPVEARDCQYRVKSALDGHERIMRESQLERRAL